MNEPLAVPVFVTVKSCVGVVHAGCVVGLVPTTATATFGLPDPVAVTLSVALGEGLRFGVAAVNVTVPVVFAAPGV